MSRDGNTYSGGVGIYIIVESEFETVREAEKRHPDLKVAKVTVKNYGVARYIFKSFATFLRCFFCF